ncbi:phospholipase-like protein [Artemisia annua]|uniref:Phospholipase-like protein n=1 Tax=Artemisia annua TaxID=35608 RepID=A0A2U1MX89_ARTAN|nr:phospholipase-like protein [Artemisia annua]
MWYDRDYEAKLIIRSKLNYFCLINQKLDAKRRNLFRSTCFGHWLDLLYFEHEPHLIDYMVQKQHRVDDSHYDMPFIYYLDGHTLHFGHPGFCLMTGLRFGSVSFEVYTSGDLKFRERVFPNKQGLIVTNLDLIGVLEDEERFRKLSDEDAIRISLLLVLEVIFMGRLLTCQVDDTLMRLVENLVAWNAFSCGEHIWTHLYDQLHNVMDKHIDKHLLGLKKNPTYVPTYTLIWILETFERCERWWTKNPNVIPRAIAWSRKSIFKRSDHSSLFEKIANFFFQNYIPRATVTSNYTLVDAYLYRLAKGRKRIAESLKVLTRDKAGGLQEYLILEELRLALAEEERLQIEHEKLMAEENLKRREEAKRIYLDGSIVWKMSDLPMKLKYFWVNRRTLRRHIDLWIDYMWHVRPKNANWAMMGRGIPVHGAMLIRFIFRSMKRTNTGVLPIFIFPLEW